ncbi:hypothetical protein Tco_0864067 [Tanacetum coccineum]
MGVEEGAEGRRAGVGDGRSGLAVDRGLRERSHGFPPHLRKGGPSTSRARAERGDERAAAGVGPGGRGGRGSGQGAVFCSRPRGLWLVSVDSLKRGFLLRMAVECWEGPKPDNAENRVWVEVPGGGGGPWTRALEHGERRSGSGSCADNGECAGGGVRCPAGDRDTSAAGVGAPWAWGLGVIKGVDYGPRGLGGGSRRTAARGRLEPQGRVREAEVERAGGFGDGGSVSWTGGGARLAVAMERRRAMRGECGWSSGVYLMNWVSNSFDICPLRDWDGREGAAGMGDGPPRGGRGRTELAADGGRGLQIE